MKRALLSLVLLAPVLLPAEDKSPAKDEKVLVLDPMVVRSVPVGSFAIDLGIIKNEATNKVDRMFVTGVQPDSDAEEAQLQPGDEILTLDGRSVKDFDANLKKDGELGRLLIERAPGDPIKIEVIVRRTQTVVLHARRIIAPLR